MIYVIDWKKTIKGVEGRRGRVSIICGRILRRKSRSGRIKEYVSRIYIYVVARGLKSLLPYCWTACCNICKLPYDPNWLVFTLS